MPPDPLPVSTIRRSPRTALGLACAAGALMVFAALTGPGSGAAEPVRKPAVRSVAAGRARPAGRIPRRAPPAPAAPVPASEAVGASPDRPAPRPAGPAAEPVEAPEPEAPETLAPERIVFVPGDPAASFAVIRGRAVRRGDRIGGRPVRAVEADVVRLGEAGEIVLRVGDHGR